MSVEQEPVTSLSVQPAYGMHQMRLIWTVQPAWQAASVRIYRSDTGAQPWTLVGGPVLAFAGEFVDTSLTPQDRMQDTYYRLLVIHAERGSYESPVVGSLDQLTRREYQHVRKILAKEERRLRKTDGIPMFHFQPLAAGVPNPKRNQSTGQILQVECPANDLESFGLPFQGGYGAAVQTWVQMMSPLSQQRTPSDDGMMLNEAVVWEAWVLPYPKPNVGHVFVNPTTDDRYVVMGEPKGHFFRGMVTVGYSVQLHLMSRDDPRYRLPVPILSSRKESLTA